LRKKKIKRNNMKKVTIAQQLKIKKFPFIINDHNGNEIYSENSDGFWIRREKDEKGNQTFAESSYGFWWKSEYNSNGNEIYFEDSDGYWVKREFDSNGKEIYCEDSDGYILDTRPKIFELTMDEIAKKFGIDVNNLKIKK
jgi:hypothetical protein